jgi:glycosyltransferase involved in cell wall biosynthesis
MKRATLVVTKGEYLRQRAIRMGINASKVINVLNGCDSNVFCLADRSAARVQLGIDDKAELVLFVGRLDPRKGIFELLEAFASLAKRRPNLRLAYIGDGPDGEQLRHKARNLAVEDRIILANACPSRKVAQWLAAANLLALPSYSEGCPNAVIEALSCGRPVVATEVGGIPELVTGKSGILVPPRNSKVLADAIEIALRRKWDERLISEQFHRSWDTAADETLTVCELAVQQGRAKWRPAAEATAVTIR